MPLWHCERILKDGNKKNDKLLLQKLGYISGNIIIT